MEDNCTVCQDLNFKDPTIFMIIDESNNYIVYCCTECGRVVSKSKRTGSFINEYKL